MRPDTDQQVRPFSRFSLRLRSVLGNTVRSCSDIVYPPHCVVTGEVLPEKTELLLSSEVQKRLLGPERLRCPRCGANVSAELITDRSCPSCHHKELPFESLYYLGSYRETLRELVLQLKRPHHEELSTALCALLWDQVGSQLTNLGIGAVVPVPMFWTRKMRRGINSAEMISEFFARKLAARNLRGVLKRRRNTRPQAYLPPKQRFRNVRGAFSLSSGYVLAAAPVLLVDDILTTGATCSEAAKTLLRAGASSVHVAVLARAEN